MGEKEKERGLAGRTGSGVGGGWWGGGLELEVKGKKSKFIVSWPFLCKSTGTLKKKVYRNAFLKKNSAR